MRKLGMIALLVCPACGDDGGGGGVTGVADAGESETGSDGTTSSGGDETTTSSGTTSSGGATTGTTGTPDSPCGRSCEVFLMCTDAYASLSECVVGCEPQFEPGAKAGEEPCRGATEAWLECIGTLDCDQYDEWDMGNTEGPDPFPCKDETIAQRDSC